MGVSKFFGVLYWVSLVYSILGSILRPPYLVKLPNIILLLEAEMRNSATTSKAWSFQPSRAHVRLIGACGRVGEWNTNPYTFPTTIPIVIPSYIHFPLSLKHQQGGRSFMSALVSGKNVCRAASTHTHSSFPLGSAQCFC